MKVELTYITPNAVEKIERIASTCYNSEPTEDFRIFKSCMKSGHMSVAEHSDITFKVTCSRACSHQLVRHRTNKYTQKSQRYVKEDNFGYYVPDSIKKNERVENFYNNIMKLLQMYYTTLTDDYNIPVEDARYILPNACETTIFVTMDFRNFFHFLNERLCTRAQKEIRDIAYEMTRLAVEACPVIKPYCVPKCETRPIPYCTEDKSCKRYKRLEEIVKEEYK